MKDKYRNTVFLLDADGTITDLQTKKPNPIIIEKLGVLIKRQVKIAIITGRSLDWIKEVIVKELTKKIGNEAGKIVLICEFGATGEYKDTSGKTVTCEEKDLFIEPVISEKLAKLALNYKESMFIDMRKKSMFTVEIKDNFSLDRFIKDRDSLLKEIKSELKGNSSYNLIFRPSSIALDIRNSRLDKYFATPKAIKLLGCNKNSKFIAVGDNIFDSEMAEEAYKVGKDTLFVYLGKEKLDKKFDFPVYIPKEKYTEGFVEFLNEYGY